MPSDTTKPEAEQPQAATCLFEDWFDPIESGSGADCGQKQDPGDRMEHTRD